MNSHITVETYPLQLSEHKFFQSVSPFCVNDIFPKILCTNIAFILSTHILLSSRASTGNQLSILKPELLDGFGPTLLMRIKAVDGRSLF